MATIVIPTPLRKFTADQSTFESGGPTVQASIDELVAACPDLAPQLLDEGGQVRAFINIFVGDDDIRGLERGATAVESSTLISIVPAIAGGNL